LSGGKAGSHTIDGTAAGFVALTQFDRSFVTDVMALPEKDGRQEARRLAREEGIFAGTSTGPNVLAALHLASKPGPGRVVATVACDTRFKYLDNDL
jgi:cysteine synthase